MIIVNGFKHLHKINNKISSKGDFYPGIIAFVENNRLEIEAIPDTYENAYLEASVEINYCPMCGRKLEEEK